MAYSDNDLAGIEQAIATGAKRVRIQGQETEFRSLAEMERTRDLIAQSLNPSLQPARRIVAVYVRP